MAKDWLVRQDLMAVVQYILPELTGQFWRTNACELLRGTGRT